MDRLGSERYCLESSAGCPLAFSLDLAFREMTVGTGTERRPGYGVELGELHFFTRALEKY